MRSSPYEEQFAASSAGQRGVELEQQRPYHAREDSKPFRYADIQPSTPLRRTLSGAGGGARDTVDFVGDRSYYRSPDADSGNAKAMIKSESHLKSPQLVRRTLRSPTPRSGGSPNTNTIANTYPYRYNGNGSGYSYNNNDNDKIHDFEFQSNNNRGVGGNFGAGSGRGSAFNGNGGSWNGGGGVYGLPPRSKTPTRHEFEELLRERREKVCSEYQRSTMKALPPQPPQRRPQLSSTSLSSLTQPSGGGYGSRNKYNYDFEFNFDFDQLNNSELEHIAPPPRQFSGVAGSQSIERLSSRVRDVDISGSSSYAQQQPQPYSAERRNYHTISSSHPSATNQASFERRPPYETAAYSSRQIYEAQTHSHSQQLQQQQQQQQARTTAYGNGGGGALYGGGNINNSTTTTTTTVVDGSGGRGAGAGGNISPIYATTNRQQQQQQQLPANNGYNNNYNATAYRSTATTTTTARGEPELSITDYPQQQQWQQHQQQQHYQLNANAMASTPSPTSSYAPTRASPSRPETPAFPVTPRQVIYNYSSSNSNNNGIGNGHNSPRTEYASGGGVDVGSYSSETIYQTLNHQQQRPRLNSTVSNDSPQEVAPHLVKFAKDSSKFWYKSTLSREEAIALLLHAEPGTFIVRDSRTYKNSYGLVLRVPQQPPYSVSGKADELVRHFLIEPTTRGVRLKDCAKEPVFGSLSAFVYEHSINRLGLPCLLRIPEVDLMPSLLEPTAAQRQLLTQGAACNVLYLYMCETESLTGVEAIRKAVRQMYAQRPSPPTTEVHFKVTQQGITLTDNTRKKFFRKHYAADIISFCAIDPDARLWTSPREGDTVAVANDKTKKGGGSANANGNANSTAVVGVAGKTIFAFVARRSPSSKYNQCHVFCDLDNNRQPAAAIVSFVNKTLPTEKGSSYAL